MNVLEFKEVSHTYQSPISEVLAIENLSFSILKGEFVCIVGPSGCGKTTLLSLLAGLIKPTKGEILIGGQVHDKPTDKVGYNLQKDQLFEWRTIYQNVILGLEVKKNLTEGSKRNAIELLKKYGLYEFKDNYPSELSGGMRQRAALIRTLAQAPEILLLDEPTSSLDYQTRLNVCDDLFTIINEERKTAVLVTHDIAEAISLGDKIYVLSKRPATIVATHNTNFNRTLPLKRRENAEFPKLFEKIWGELNV